VKPIDIFYQGEHIREIDHLEADAKETFGTVRARLMEKHELDADVLLFLEDGEEPLNEAVTVETVAGKGGVKAHLHRCRRVEVAVTFAGETVNRDFGPGTTVAAVKRWAAEGKFGMTKEDAGEHVLQIAGTHDRPSPGTHIGTLAACPACRVIFDLVPDQRVNGASARGF
jgi:hypothetical protein